MPRKAKAADTAEMVQIIPEKSGLDGSESADNAKCEISVKSEKSAEKQTKTRKSAAKSADILSAEPMPNEHVQDKTRRSGTKKADPGILDDTAHIEEQKPKKERRYTQKVPNDEVRKRAALEYIEKKTKPKTSPKANGHFPNSDLALKVEPGDNSRFVAFGLTIYNMAPIDINDADQVNGRINDYFQLCIMHDMKPGVADLSMALGITRHRVLEIVNDAETRSNVPSDTRTLIKKAHAYMGGYWERIMQSGKINPASGIFLGKNNFGYRDAVEHVVTPNIKTSDQMAPADLQRRIEAIPDD